jgi:hypothetical protein
MPLALPAIATAADFDAMALDNGGLLVQGKSVKFLIDARQPQSPHIYYMNSNHRLLTGERPEALRYHYYFARAVLANATPPFTARLGEFNRLTYATPGPKQFYAGLIQVYRIRTDGQPDFLLYGMQFFPQDVIQEQEIATAAKIVRDTFRVPGVQRAFVATGPQQTVNTVAGALADMGFQARSTDQILGSLPYMAMNLGHRKGRLRRFDGNSEGLEPIDIPIFDELPLDLSVVAATITARPQDTGSHIFLKSKERKTPDMYLRDPFSDPRIVNHLDQFVELVVGPDDFDVRPSTADEAWAELNALLPSEWSPLDFEAETRLLAYDEMCPDDVRVCLDNAHRYGSKAANLGFLAQPQVLGRAAQGGTLSASLGYDASPLGMGVPIQYYFDFVAAQDPNGDLRQSLDALIRAEMAGQLTLADRDAAATHVRQLFYAAPFPSGMLEAIRAKLQDAAPGTDKFKVRSSANAEDRAHFDGAGLYDSFSAHLHLAEPDGPCELADPEPGEVDTKLAMRVKSLGCAIRGVYASLWNKRAIEERSFARLDHQTAGMGIAIVPSYTREVDNAVALTRVVNSQGVFGYSFSLQQGENLVTNPNPGTVAELTIAAIDPELPTTYTTVRFATPVAGAPPLGGPILGRPDLDRLVQITQQVEQAYCAARPDYYVHTEEDGPMDEDRDCGDVSLDPAKPKSLDLEFKMLASDQGLQMLCKQFREFSGR